MTPTRADFEEAAETLLRLQYKTAGGIVVGLFDIHCEVVYALAAQFEAGRKYGVEQAAKVAEDWEPSEEEKRLNATYAEYALDCVGEKCAEAIRKLLEPAAELPLPK